MRARYPTAWVDEVFARADIVDIVSGYLPLKRQGRNYIGLCPFHNEKTPSFSVNRENNVYHCFGCKAGGSVVQFVMEMERLSYPDALLHIAKQLNIAPPVMEYNPRAEMERSRRERILAANREAALFFHEKLYQVEGKPMLDYLHSRGVDDAMIRRFGLGASDEEWSSLLDDLVKKGYTKEELSLAGLVHLREGHAYDTFRGRVMFPILDAYGNTLGFGARAMGSVQPKYLNTQDTPVFNKRMGVYAINLLRKLRNLDRVLLVEGYMDVIALSKYGVDGVVATLGTALTAEQARMMKKFAPEVWVAYDGDEAGQLATLRALDILQQETIPARVLHFPAGVDPDDLLQKGGRPALDALRPQTALGFRLERLKSSYDMQTDEGVGSYSIEACRMIAALPHPVERDRYLTQLSHETGIDKGVLSEQLQHALGRGESKPSEKSGDLRPRRKAQAGQERSKAERTLLSLLAAGHLPKGLVLPEDFAEDLHGRLAQALLEGGKPARILDDLEDEQERLAASEVFGAAAEVSREQAMQAAEQCLRTLREAQLNARIDALRRTLDSEEAGTDRKQALMDIMKMQTELNELRTLPQTGKDVP